MLAGIKLILRSQRELANDDLKSYTQWHKDHNLGNDMLPLGNCASEAASFLSADEISAKPVLSWLKYLLRNYSSSDIGIIKGGSMEEKFITSLSENLKKNGCAFL
jgi:hypothetical protein